MHPKYTFYCKNIFKQNKTITMEEMSDCEYSFLEALGRDKVKYFESTQNGGLGQAEDTIVRPSVVKLL